MRPFYMLLVAGAGIALASTGGGNRARADATTQRVDPRADELLRKMSTNLSQTKAFQFDASHTTEVVTKDKQNLQIRAESSVSVERPNKLRSDRSGPLADVTFYYDGNNVTIYGKRANLYATTKAPGNLDETIDFTRDRLSLDAPAADLLNSDPYKVLMDDVVSGVYVDEEPIGDRLCHHLAYRGTATDWQIWIEDSPQALPCRFEITSKRVAGAPEFAVEMSNWKTEPALPANLFVFTPPPESEKVDFLTAPRPQPAPTGR